MSWFNLAAGAVSGALGFLGQHNANQSNERINNQNNQFNAEQAAINRAWQSNEAKLQREAEMQNQRELMALQHKYDSPAEQARQLAQAGYNPNMLGSPSSQIAAGSLTSAFGSSPASASPAVPQVNELNPAIFSDTMLALSQSRLNNAEAEVKEKTLPGIIKQQNMTLDLSAYDLQHLKPAQQKELEARANSLSKTAELSQQQIEESIHRVELMKLDKEQMQKYLSKFDDMLTAELNERLAHTNEMRAHVPLIASQIKENLSQVLLNSAMSKNQLAQAAVAKTTKNILGVEYKYKGQQLKLAYDSAKHDYQLKVAQDEKEERKAGKRNNFSNPVNGAINDGLDAMEVILESVGSVLTKIKL